MLNSKLYTEEQVRTIIGKAQMLNWDDEFLFSEDYLIKSEIPIELPSFTDLEKKAFELHKNSLLEFNSYLDGGKFVIDKIEHTK